MYAGMSFMLKMPTMTRMKRTTSRPPKLTPFCLRMFFSLPQRLVERPEAAELVQVEPDEERLADDILVRDEAPDAAVARVVAVVAHHEVLARRHGARHSAHIVVAISGERERARGRREGRRVLVDQDLVVDAVQALDEA